MTATPTCPSQAGDLLDVDLNIRAFADLTVSIPDAASFLPAGASLVEIDPTQPSRLYAGIHDGERVMVMVSGDDGATWQAPP